MPVTVCEFESRPGHSENGLQVIVGHFSFLRSQHSVSKWSVALNFEVKNKTFALVVFSYEIFRGAEEYDCMRLAISLDSLSLVPYRHFIHSALMSSTTD